MNTKTHIEMLGFEVRDMVTGQTGIVTSVSFDLFGCMQCIITPKSVDGKNGDAGWYDSNRLEIVSERRVMPLPMWDYSDNGIVKQPHGPAYKPIK